MGGIRHSDDFPRWPQKKRYFFRIYCFVSDSLLASGAVVLFLYNAGVTLYFVSPELRHLLLRCTKSLLDLI